MDQIKVKIGQDPEIKVKVYEEPDIIVKIDGTRGDIGEIPPHTHEISDINGLQSELDNKANKGDNTDITSLGGITGGISTVDYIDFNTLPIEAIQEARVRWNETDGTLEIGLKGGNVVLQVGQEQVTMVQNNTGSNLFEGQAVYLQGSTGNNLNILLAQANSEQKSSKTFGVLTENINHNNKGFVTTSGLVRNINTAHLTQGAAIWLDPNTPGGLTSTKPIAPNHLVLVGWCVRQHATVGTIFVHVQNGYELEELHNVLITALQDGDVLSYNATTGLWENKQAQVEKSLNDLTDVDLNDPLLGQVIKYNGYKWINAEDTTGTQTAIQDSFTATLGQQSFTLSQNTSDIAIITVNGVQQEQFIDYNLSGTSLAFTYGLEDGDKVLATYSLPLAGINTFTKRLSIDNPSPNNNTTGIMYLDGISSKLFILQNEVKSFTGTVVMKDIANTGSIASWEIKGCVAKFSTNSSIQFIGSPTIIVLGKSQSALDNGFELFVELDTVNGCLQLRNYYTNGGTTRAVGVLRFSETI